jgi:acyl-CoA hydrolase
MLMGTRRLYRFADRNPSIRIRATSYTHDALVLGNFRHFVAINGALEVDLTGQVNAETAAGRHIGLVGGQMDFVRAANRAPQGAIGRRAAIDQPRPHPLAHRRQARGWRCHLPARRG